MSQAIFRETSGQSARCVYASQQVQSADSSPSARAYPDSQSSTITSFSKGSSCSFPAWIKEKIYAFYFFLKSFFGCSNPNIKSSSPELVPQPQATQPQRPAVTDSVAFTRPDPEWRTKLQEWGAEKVYVVYDPTYTKQAPSEICTACKVIRYYDTAHATYYPHEQTCQYENSKFSLGYVVGPKTTLCGDTFQKVIKCGRNDLHTSSTTFGPYQRCQLFRMDV